MLLDAAAAIVSADKLRDYLLSSAHPIGRYKSAFFRSLGYAQDQWHVLERDLRAVLSNEAQPAGVMEYGQKFTVRGALLGPNGRSAGIVSVWIILTGETAPRLVTVYPED
jgi:uncharacterized protein DUF6883